MGEAIPVMHAKVETFHVPGQISLAQLREQALDQTRGPSIYRSTLIELFHAKIFIVLSFRASRHV